MRIKILFQIDLIGESKIEDESKNEVVTIKEQLIDETRVKRDTPTDAYSSGSGAGDNGNANSNGNGIGNGAILVWSIMKFFVIFSYHQQLTVVEKMVAYRFSRDFFAISRFYMFDNSHILRHQN